ncbi:hypothetical protein OH491_17490 [Termitidicoccus mucosus]|uniref:ASCH domain-containing protein n=1 Tax=Termitidicoccus mucosus TaxID=1184151 RepID=A0A178IJJ1_9BACT|nr:hypothetical protein AW736_11110 [Opitutaceae bacterium TSB47]
MKTEPEKPLFIPLNSEHFIAFEKGQKRTEYRTNGPRWNEHTCRIGREVVLSFGYTKMRLRGTVVGFRVRKAHEIVNELTNRERETLDTLPGPYACIEISELRPA